MTIECYDTSCQYHSFHHEGPDEGPFCYEPFCKKALLEKIEPELVRLENGFCYWHPQHKGALSADDLRLIADVLDERNAELNEKLKEHFLGEFATAEEARKEDSDK